MFGARRSVRLLEGNDVPAGLRRSGLTAPLVIDGAVNGAAFVSYIQQHLASTLNAGDIQIMGNLASHKVSGMRQACEARGARIPSLPPYSPDLNPIDRCVLKVQMLLRSAEMPQR